MADIVTVTDDRGNFLTEHPIISLILGITFFAGVFAITLIGVEARELAFSSLSIELVTGLSASILTGGLVVIYAVLTLKTGEQADLLEQQVKLMATEFEPDARMSLVDIDDGKLIMRSRNNGPGSALNMWFEISLLSPENADLQGTFLPERCEESDTDSPGCLRPGQRKQFAVDPEVKLTIDGEAHEVGIIEASKLLNEKFDQVHVEVIGHCESVNGDQGETYIERGLPDLTERQQFSASFRVR